MINNQEKLIHECLNCPTPIEDRLEGNYQIGPGGEFGIRNFSGQPIIQLAAARLIRELKNRIHPTEYINNAIRTKSSFNKSNDVDSDVLHAALGISTEAAELLDAVKKKIFYDKPIDYVNCDEEIGDLLWYVAIYLNFRAVSFEQIMKKNIEKLKSRYPDKFTSDNAIHRNTEQERQILES